MRVDRYFRVFRSSRYPFIDVKQPMEDLTEPVEIDDEEPLILHPRRVRARLDARATRPARRPRCPARGQELTRPTRPADPLDRRFVDPGWDGHVTLELSNVANLPITLYASMKIGQLSFMELSEPAETPYGSASIGSKYQGQRGPTPSRYWQNFT